MKMKTMKKQTPFFPRLNVAIFFNERKSLMFTFITLEMV